MRALIRVTFGRGRPESVGLVTYVTPIEGDVIPVVTVSPFACPCCATMLIPFLLANPQLQDPCEVGPA